MTSSPAVTGLPSHSAMAARSAPTSIRMLTTNHTVSGTSAMAVRRWAHQ